MKWFFSLLLIFALTSRAADTNPDRPAEKPKPKDQTFLDPGKAGQDYADQGEYKNDWGGAQVIALGDDKFRMVSYRGGLPGAGWDKEFKQEVGGKRDANKIVFAGENEYRAELADGKITINSANGGPWTMEKNRAQKSQARRQAARRRSRVVRWFERRRLVGRSRRRAPLAASWVQEQTELH